MSANDVHVHSLYTLLCSQLSRNDFTDTLQQTDILPLAA